MLLLIEGDNAIGREKSPVCFLAFSSMAYPVEKGLKAADTDGIMNNSTGIFREGRPLLRTESAAVTKVLQYWDRALLALENGEQRLRDIFLISFGFSDNPFFEWTRDGHICRMRYGECRVLVEAAAAKIADTLKDVKKNAFIGLLLDNSPEWVIAFWAILMAGYRPLLLNTRIDDEQNCRLVREAAAVALVAQKPLFDCPFFDAADFLKPSPTASKCTPTWADGLALCSSGTSDLPKLCVFDGKAICAQILNSGYVLKKNNTINTYFHGELKLLAFLPFCHVFGLIANLLWFSFFGRTFVLLNDLSPNTIQDACRRHGVTHIFAIPLLFNTVTQTVRRQAAAQGQAEQLEKALTFSLRIQTLFPRLGTAFVRKLLFRKLRERVLGPSVKFCITGGGFVPADTLRVWNGLGYALYNGFGMTEVGISSVELRLRADKRLLGTVGVPFPSAEYSIRDGELLIRGRSLFCSLLRDGKERPREADSYYATGDLAHQDKDGYYYVDGRKDDLIITDGGEKLSPDEGESRFLSERVVRVCLLGLRGENAHTAVTLVAQLADALPPLQRERAIEGLFAVNASLPIGLQAERILLADEPLPAVLNCKVRRGEVRERLAAGTLAFSEAHPGGLPAEERRSIEYERVLDGLMHIFAEVLDRDMDSFTPRSHLVYDLGCGSMQYFALLGRIGETFGVSVDMDGKTPCATAEEFAGYIVGKA